MKKTTRKSFYHCFILLLTLGFLILFSGQMVSAAVITLKNSSLKNVTKAETVEGTWKKTKTGTMRFVPAAGKTIKSRWIKVDDKVYYLNAKGCRVTGWVKYRNNQYFLKKDGSLRLGWLGKKYLLPSNGTMAKKLKTIDGKKYYFGTDGNYITGWEYISGKWYYFGKNGVYDPSVKAPVINPKKPMVALTFDDGPGMYTDRLLNCLEKNNARATFFMVGSNVSRYTSTVKRMKNLKCELGNHSWSHPVLSQLSNTDIRSQISRTNEAIQKAAGQKPTVCRLPYGSGHNSSRVLNAIGLPSIYWSIDTRDWANTGNSRHTVNAVLNNVKNGDIILMHDIHRASVNAAETIIPVLKQRGYQLVTVSEFAEYKAKTKLKTGKTYYNFH